MQAPGSNIAKNVFYSGNIAIDLVRRGGLLLGTDRQLCEIPQHPTLVLIKLWKLRLYFAEEPWLRVGVIDR